MKIPCRRQTAGLTLIEVLIAVGILAMVVAAIYSTWTSILKATRVGLDAAAAAQRERISMEVLEEALAYTQMYAANVNWYGFVADTGGDEARLSFVTRLPKSFPRGGKFGDLDLRRVEFSLHDGPDGDRELILKQAPLLMDFDKDEDAKPLVLARNVKKLEFEFWDSRKNDWVDDWTQSNQVPRVVKATLVLGHPSTYTFGNTPPDREITRIIPVHAIGVAPAWEMAPAMPVPGLPGAPGTPTTPGMPPGPVPVGPGGQVMQF